MHSTTYQQLKNHYVTLGLEITATIEEIKKAYRLKAIKYHPDKHFGDPYFTEKFIEVKEAYDVLSDPEQREIYDEEYRAFFTKEEPERQQTVREEKRKETEKEEEFFYNPHKPFYSFKDRNLNETPQFEPEIDHFGEPLADNVDFFQLPKNIGKIISGYSTLRKGVSPSTAKDKTRRFAKSLAVAAIISVAIIFIFNVENGVWMAIWIIAPLVLAIMAANFANSFSHTCNFIGVNGFAQFKIQENRKNLTESYEVNFNNITDFVKATVVKKQNFNYAGTDFSFAWFNENKIVKEVNGTHQSKEGKPDKERTDFWLNEIAEKYWTIYLLDNMEKELESNGYLSFSLYNYQNGHFVKTPYIQLGIGFIKFITPKGEVTYKFNDIKRVYTKGGNLFIEHKNFEKILFFFKSGNKNGIPLTNLSNRQFFFKAMELLIGYKF